MSTFWRQFTSAVRDAAGGPPPPRDPSNSNSLAEKLGLAGPRALSDEALGGELERRRRARGKPANRRPAADDELDAAREARRARMKDRPASKAYASLELRPGATRGEVERAYRTLLRQYHPDRHLGDAEEHAGAVAVATGLTDAYLFLLQQHDRR